MANEVLNLETGVTWVQFKQLRLAEVNAVKIREGKAVPISPVNAVGLVYHDDVYYRMIIKQTTDGEYVTLELGETFDEKPGGSVLWIIEPYPGTRYGELP